MRITSTDFEINGKIKSTPAIQNSLFIFQELVFKLIFLLVKHTSWKVIQTSFY
jgi:hypothetical protein